MYIMNKPLASAGGFLYAENQTIAEWFNSSLSNVRRTKTPFDVK